MNQKVIELKHISKSFPGVKALEDVSFDLSPGEIHCIVGGNGAGKSTLIKILSGMYTPDSGEIVFDKTESYPSLTPHLSRQKGIQTIYQETMLAPTLSVAENVFLGDSLIVKNGVLNWPLMKTKANELFELMSVNIPADKIVGHLGIADKQSVQIAKALANDACVMIFDEPTASFGKKEVDSLFEIIHKLKERGVGIIYISHRLEEVFEIADRISVFKDGKCVSQHDGHDVDKDVLISEMVGRATRQFYERERVPVGETVLKVENLSGNGVKNASFELRKGEILGISGMVGSKRTELMKLLFGAARVTGGTIVYRGQKLTPKSPRDMIGRGLCMITEERAVTGLMLKRSLKENIVLCKNAKSGRGILNLSEEKRLAAAEMKRLRIKAESPSQLVENLSGGNQQKIILAKWLLTQGDVFIMDEPTRGIDIGAKEEFYKLMVEIARNGGAILLVSSDMLEVVSISDRIVVMSDGETKGELSLPEISEESILRIVVGG